MRVTKLRISNVEHRIMNFEGKNNQSLHDSKFDTISLFDFAFITPNA